jgi:hypothetical protein
VGYISSKKMLYELVSYEVGLQMLEVAGQQFISTQQLFAVLLRQLLLL